jgi:PAS domain S-box-containing protein
MESSRNLKSNFMKEGLTTQTLPYSSLRVRLMLLVLLAIIPALAIFYYNAIVLHQREAARVETDVLILTRLVASREEQLIEGARQLLIALTQLSAVRSDSAETCSTRLSELLRLYRRYSGFGVARPDGELFCRTFPLDRPLNVSNRAWFQRAIQARNFSVGDYQIGQTSGEAIIVFSYPILDSADQVQGVIFAVTRLDRLNELAAQAPLPEGTVLTIVDRNGTILAHHPNPEQWMGQTLPNAPLVKTVLSQEEGQAEVAGLDDVTRLYAFTPLYATVETGVYLAAGIPKEIAFAQIDRIWLLNLFWLGLIGLLALLAAWFGSDFFILRQVKTLMRATHRLRNDLSARTGLSHQAGELGQLARAFDEMAAALEQREAERRQVAEELRLSRDQLAVVLQGIADGVIAQEPTGNLIYVNDTAAQIVGYPSAQALLETSMSEMVQKFEVFDEEGKPFPLDQLPGRLLLQGEPSPAVTTVHFRVIETGEERWSMIKVRPIFGNQGQVILAVNIFHDITELKRTEHTQRVLAEAGRILGSSFDYETRLSNLAQLAVPYLADWCSVTIIKEDGSTRQVAIAHADPAKVTLAHDLERRYPLEQGISSGVSKVLHTGQPELYSNNPDAVLEAASRNPEHRAVLSELKLRSAMFVPLIARERIIGVMTFIWAESGRRYDDDDLALAEELAQRAAMAVDNARLYKEAQKLNAELEQRVAQRTAELQAANIKLKQEIIERKQIEETLRNSEARLINDITERKQIEAELTEVRYRLTESREAERLHLAQELHDGPIQDLYSVSYRLNNLWDALPDEISRGQLVAAQATLQRMIQLLRALCGELRPPTLTPFGLEKAIRSHADQFQESHPELEMILELASDGQILGEQIRLALFRVYQEALNNIVRHAQAHHIWIRLMLADEQIILEIQDDGHGFEIPKRRVELARQGHLGLVGATERIEAIGGELSILSTPGNGTTIRATVPRSSGLEIIYT